MRENVTKKYGVGLETEANEMRCVCPPPHSTENTGTTNTHEVLVEFKDFNPCDDDNTGEPEIMRTNAITFAHTESSVIASVVKNERAAFESVKNRDKKTYAELMATEMTVISADEGMLDRNATLKSFDSESLSNYSLDDIKGVFVDSNVVLLTYKLHIKTSLAGNPHEGDFLVSSLWVNRNGAWKNVLNQETATALPEKGYSEPIS